MIVTNGDKIEVLVLFVSFNAFLFWYHTLNEFSTINPIPLNGPGFSLRVKLGGKYQGYPVL